MADTGVWVYARNAVPIPDFAYGVNNDWARVTKQEFPKFAKKLTEFGYKLLRYPGGWESEYYHWQNNSLVGWPTTKVQPDGDGATPEDVLSLAPAASFVLRTREYLINDTPAMKYYLGDVAVSTVRKYKDRVSIWEIGNEWFKFAGDHAINLQRYIAVAKHIAWRVKDVDPNAEIYVTGDWEQPNDFKTMVAGFKDAWAKVDGVALHIYTGDDLSTEAGAFGAPANFHISTVTPRINTIKEITGLSKVYVSEWNVSKAYTKEKVNLQAANVLILAMWHMLRVGISAAAIWPPVDANPGLNLTDTAFTEDYPPGQAFAWMASDMVGDAVNTTYQEIPAVAARKGNRLVVFLLGHNKGRYDVTINLAGYTIQSVLSADVMYSSAPYAAEKANIQSLPSPTSTSSTVKVTINPGGAGRGSNWEIIRLVLDGVVEQ